ncbi:conjugative transposon protein TraM [Pedobacter paludis]|uniref:Conjugative transposon protein TraM n=1 Tax=Pedobacter paludis TaxID=2203212 RepID=A0A317F1Q1_9SPHI|nr:conjugative transposon protein TraM [Pedobacter paludis]PWS32183.1 conjugative transposon protein TraM [Pedobacter paludis]
MEITEKQPHTRAYQNQRKLMVMLPIIIVPFMTILFWLFGGGSGEASAKAEKHVGINTSLPGAELKTEGKLDKMAFYKLAEKDSADQESISKRDPYMDMFNNRYAADSSMSGQAIPERPVGPYISPSPYGNRFGEQNEARIQEKLNALSIALNTPPQASQNALGEQAYRPASPVMNTSDIDRLEAMMNQANAGGERDPEMQQISTMLNQILDIQHPDRVKLKIQEASSKERGKVFPVSASAKPINVSVLEAKEKDSGTIRNGFYSLNEQIESAGDQNAIQAVIHESQTLVNGATIKLRLLNDIYINGQLVPRNTFVYAIGNISGERMTAEVASIRSGNSIFPVRLSVFDLDGINGMYIPGAISRDVAKGSADQALQNITLGANTIDPSMGMQAMSMGVEAAKGLMSKKVKLIKVTVKAGYKVLLRDQNNKTE